MDIDAIRKYNTEIAPQIRAADVCVANVFNAVDKTTVGYDAVHQLECLGWTDEVIKIIRTALSWYQKWQLMRARNEAPEEEMVLASSFSLEEIVFSENLSVDEVNQFIQLLRKVKGFPD